MGISKRIAEAIDRMCAGDAESALIPACIAVAATSHQVYPTKSDNQSYKDWLHDNLALITRVGMGNVSIANFYLKYKHPDLKPDNNDYCSLEQILYHVVRCGLIHNAELPSTIKFTSEGVIKIDNDGILTLGSSLIYGLIVAVIVCPVNAGGKIPADYSIIVAGKTLPLNRLWGNKATLFNLLEANETV